MKTIINNIKYSPARIVFITSTLSENVLHRTYWLNREGDITLYPRYVMNDGKPWGSGKANVSVACANLCNTVNSDLR